ncbi:hypothetical protein FACS1894216_14280 [Synergistales bacterium]|nr:hypothetical protein FACS1894216_14280 [Synergistales bacterium]
MNFFDEVFLFDENKLSVEFTEHFADKFKLRGAGYWCWKPQVILLSLEKLNEGDVLMYADAGCDFNPVGIKRLEEYFDMAEKNVSGIICFSLCFSRGESCPEKNWTKGDVFDYFGARFDEKFTESGQIAATVILVRKSAETIAFIKKWLDVFWDHFDLVDDSPSVSPNIKGFIENRHDQSIFSILAKKTNIAEECLSMDEIEWHGDPKYSNKPIRASRHKKPSFAYSPKRWFYHTILDFVELFFPFKVAVVIKKGVIALAEWIKHNH